MLQIKLLLLVLLFIVICTLKRDFQKWGFLFLFLTFRPPIWFETIIWLAKTITHNCTWSEINCACVLIVINNNRSHTCGEREKARCRMKTTKKMYGWTMCGAGPQRKRRKTMRFVCTTTILLYLLLSNRLLYDKTHLSIAQILRIVWGEHNYCIQMANNLLSNYTLHSIFIVDVVALLFRISLRECFL